MELGYRLTAVDASAAMLERIRGARKVHARIEDLALGEVFDLVLLMSNLVNTPDVGQRRAFLRCCRLHVAPSGIVLIERLSEHLGLGDPPTPRKLGEVIIRTLELRRRGPIVAGTIEFDADERGRWRQRFEQRVLSHRELATELERAGLRFVRWIDPPRRWGLAVPAVPMEAG